MFSEQIRIITPTYLVRRDGGGERTGAEFSTGYSQDSFHLYFTEISAHSDKMLADAVHTEKQVVNNLSIDTFNKYPNV